MSKSKKAKRFMELEGLRGLAALVVVLHHVVYMFYTPLNTGKMGVDHNPFPFEQHIYGTPLALVYAGTLAVAIFFVLSGFVLSIGYFQTKNKAIIRKLAASRYLRLMLPALASVLIAYVVMASGLNGVLANAAATIGGGSGYANALQFDASFLDALKNGAIEIFVSDRHPYNTVLWTMFIEFWGSFMVFGFLLLFAKLKYRWLAYLAFSVLTFNTWFLPFIIGMVIADLYANGWFKKVKHQKYIVPALLTGAVVFGSFPNQRIKGTVYENLNIIQTLLPDIHRKMFFVTLAATLLLVAVLMSKPLASWLKRVSWLGKYTYSLYLTHKFVLFVFASFIFLTFLPMGYNKAVFFAVTLSIPVFILVTYLFEKYIDAPSIRLASKFARLFSRENMLSLQERWVELRMRAIYVRYLIRYRLFPDRADDE
ncbi:MAG TPA: acyltransferase [Candidatus Saccharimonadales bacterium]